MGNSVQAHLSQKDAFEAYSRLSDSKKWPEVKRGAKKMKAREEERGERWKRGNVTLPSPTCIFPHFFYFLPFLTI